MDISDSIFDDDAVDNQDSDEFNSEERYKTIREATLYVIDCQANLLNKMTAPRGKINNDDSNRSVPQLFYILHCITSYLKSQILMAPLNKFGIVLFNTGTSQNDQGIHILHHPSGEAIDTLTPTFLQNLLKIQTVQGFTDNVGISPYLEGTTDFSNILFQIQSLFTKLPSQSKTSTSVYEKTVTLFTSNYNPTLLPYLICRNRAGTDNRDSTVQFRGRNMTLGQVLKHCQQDATFCSNRMPHIKTNISFCLVPTAPAFILPPKVITSSSSATATGGASNTGGLSGSGGTQQNGSQASVKMGTGGSYNHHGSSSSQGMNDNINSLSSNTTTNNNNIKNDLVQLGQDPIRQLTHGTIDNLFCAVQDVSFYQNDAHWLALITTQSSIHSSTPNIAIVPPFKMEEFEKQQLQQQNQFNTTMSVKSHSTIPLSITSTSNMSTQSIIKDHFSPTFFVALFGPHIQEDIDSRYTTMRNLRIGLERKSYHRRVLTTLPMLIPSPLPGSKKRIALGLDVFSHIVKTKATFSTDIHLKAGVNAVPVHSVTKQVTVTGAPLSLQASDIATYYPFGGNEMIFFSQQDIKKVKDFGEPSIELLYFQPYDDRFSTFNHWNVKFEDNVKPSYLLHCNDTKYPGSKSIFQHLLTTLSIRRLCGVVRVITRRFTMPRFAILIPNLEIDDDALLQYNRTDYLSSGNPIHDNWDINKSEALQHNGLLGDVLTSTIYERQQRTVHNTQNAFMLIMLPFKEEVRQPAGYTKGFVRWNKNMFKIPDPEYANGNDNTNTDDIPLISVPDDEPVLFDDTNISLTKEYYDTINTAAKDLIAAFSSKTTYAVRQQDHDNQIIQVDDAFDMNELPHNPVVEAKLRVIAALALGTPLHESIDGVDETHRDYINTRQHVKPFVSTFIDLIMQHVTAFTADVAPATSSRRTAKTAVVKDEAGGSKRVKAEAGTSAGGADADGINSIDWAQRKAQGTMSKLTNDQLKIYLRHHGLGLTGKKADFVERIEAHLP